MYSVRTTYFINLKHFGRDSGINFNVLCWHHSFSNKITLYYIAVYSPWSAIKVIPLLNMYSMTSALIYWYFFNSVLNPFPSNVSMIAWYISQYSHHNLFQKHAPVCQAGSCHGVPNFLSLYEKLSFNRVIGSKLWLGSLSYRPRVRQTPTRHGVLPCHRECMRHAIQEQHIAYHCWIYMR